MKSKRNYRRSQRKRKYKRSKRQTQRHSQKKHKRHKRKTQRHSQKNRNRSRKSLHGKNAQIGGASRTLPTVEYFIQGYSYTHKLPEMKEVYGLSQSDGGGLFGRLGSFFGGKNDVAREKPDVVIKHLIIPRVEHPGYYGHNGYYGNGFRELLYHPSYASRSFLVEILAFSDYFEGRYHPGHPAYVMTGHPAYVMKLCEGDTSKLIEEGMGIKGSTTRDYIIGKFTQIFDQLHTDGFVHGDIKPSNVFFSNRGVETILKIGDVDGILFNDTVELGYGAHTIEYRPYHMEDIGNNFGYLMGIFDREELFSIYENMKPLLEEKNGLVTDAHQTHVNTDTDRWSMGLCICEFYTGKKLLRNQDILERWKIHFYLCYIYYLSVNPDVVDSIPIRVTELPQLFDGEEERLGSPTYNTMIEHMIQYCLPQKVRSLIEEDSLLNTQNVRNPIEKKDEEGGFFGRLGRTCFRGACSSVQNTGLPPGVGDYNRANESVEVT